MICAFEDFDIDSVKRVEDFPYGRKVVTAVILGLKSLKDLWDMKHLQYWQIKL